MRLIDKVFLVARMDQAKAMPCFMNLRGNARHPLELRNEGEARNDAGRLVAKEAD